MKAVVIIPARYDSTRLPGKLVHPEAKRDTGKHIIEHVYERVKKTPLIENVIVATDDKRIFDVVKGFGGNVEMTSPNHKSGTDRIAEVAAHRDEDVVVNVQGDEPEIRPEMIEALVSALSADDEAVMATLANELKTVDELLDPNVVKVVLDNDGYALYFSRSPIPYVREHGQTSLSMPPHLRFPFLRHLGIYAYRRDFLLRYSKLPPSPLEETERLEQLRALSNGYRIKVSITPFECRGIDTEEDLKRFIDKFRVKS
jgi:3-deoxy-manno-octulosonate cytidylyltransferase (CMP-KDO synthetase)